MNISVLLPSKSEPNVQSIMNQVEGLYSDIVGQIITCNDHDGLGKGWAVRQALMAATGDQICILDADGDISPRMLARLLPFIQDYDIVVGVKPISGLWSRRLLTFLSRIYLAIMFNIKVDTQTGIKLFRRDAVQEFKTNGFLFDLEMLAQAKKKGFRMIEVPIEANINRRMKLSSIWKTLKESVDLWLRLR